MRFVASSLFAEMIHREKFKSQRSLYEQSGKVFWVNDLELLMVNTCIFLDVVIDIVYVGFSI